MLIKEYDSILLKDGRKGVVMEVFKNPDICLVDVEIGIDDYDHISVFPQDIANVIME
ncbi:MAG: hypothetical protein FWG63_03365 [Defluviitaleaceae bacterium]|nr:hypothetical protein [Defluviitaleaceae bacterium]